jgi:hypothetical protein
MTYSMLMLLVIQGTHTPIWEVCLFVAALLIPILVFLLWPLVWTARDEGSIDETRHTGDTTSGRTATDSNQNGSDNPDEAAPVVRTKEAIEAMGPKSGGHGG